MADSIRERDVIKLWHLIWPGRGFVVVDCRDPRQPNGSPARDRRLINNENDFVAWARQWNGVGNCYCGRNVRDADGKSIPAVTAVSFDIDPLYDKSVGATVEQMRECLGASRILLNHYPGGYLASSGNGALVLYSLKGAGPLDGARTAEKLADLEDSLRRTVLHDFNGRVRLDNTSDNARLIRLVGTKNVKGRSENQRYSRFVQDPEAWETPRKLCLALSQGAGSNNDKTSLPAVAALTADPWVTQLLEGVGEGQRHQALVRLAGYLLGKHPEDVARAMLVQWNTRNTPPMDNAELFTTLDDLANRYKATTYAETNPLGAHLPITSLPTYESWSRKNSGRPEFPTALDALDQHARIRRGDIHLIVARTGLGKSTLATDFARQFIKAGKRVLMFSTEMNFTEVWERYWAQDLGLSAADIHNKLLNGHSETLQLYKSNTFKNLPFYVYDNARLTTEIILREVDRAQPDVIILDYFQYIETGTEHRATELAKIAKALKDIARTHDVAVVITAQAHDKRDWKSNQILKTNMTDVKETKALVDTASTVLVLNWAGGDSQEDTGQQYASIELDVQKNRHGPKFKALVKMDRSVPTFYGN